MKNIKEHIPNINDKVAKVDVSYVMLMGGVIDCEYIITFENGRYFLVKGDPFIDTVFKPDFLNPYGDTLSMEKFNEGFK